MMRRVDLLPAIYEERRRERRNFFLVIIAGLVVLLLLVGWWFVLGFQVSSASDDLAERQAANQELTEQIAELQEFADLETEVQTKRTSLQTVMAGDLDWPALMTELAMVIPDDVWLLSLSASAGQTEGATGVATESNPIDIDSREPFGRILFEGEALSMRAIGNWLIRLETVDEFLAVYLGSATGSAEEPTFGFTNSIELGEESISGRFQEGTLDETDDEDDEDDAADEVEEDEANDDEDEDE